LVYPLIVSNLPPQPDTDLPLADAVTRYGIGRTALHARIRHCGINPLRTGNRSFLTPDQVTILDSLHDHLEGGRGMADFYSPIAELVEPQPSPSGERSPIVHQPNSAPVRVEFPTIAPPDRIDELRRLLEFLSDCSANGWLLPTSTIKDLLGTAPARSGWSRYGFVFEAAGQHGNQTAWAIAQPDSSEA
jgi:hypothetical protein